MANYSTHIIWYDTNCKLLYTHLLRIHNASYKSWWNGHSWKQIIINFNEVWNSQIKSIAKFMNATIFFCLRFSSISTITTTTKMWLRIDVAHMCNILWGELESDCTANVSAYESFDIDSKSGCHLSKNTTRKLFCCQSMPLLREFECVRLSTHSRVHSSYNIIFFLLFHSSTILHKRHIASFDLAASGNVHDDRLSIASVRYIEKINFDARMAGARASDYGNVPRKRILNLIAS